MTRNSLPDILFKRLDMIEPYPEKVAKVDAMCSSTAFFPGGRGLWKENSEIFPDILVLGQDFSTVKYYEEILKGIRKDTECPTWQNLIELFKDKKVNLDLNRCFFSNVFMGLRIADSMTGKFPGYGDKEFMARNLNFLNFQIETIKPKIIITLGKYPADMLSRISPEDLKEWKDGEVLKLKDLGLKRIVRFKDHICTCIALEHPSFRKINVRRREYKGCIGNKAEVEMLSDGLK